MSYMTKPTYAQNKQFKAVFGCNVSQYWDYFLGSLDCVALDEKLIKAPDGVSMRDHIQAVYGEQAVNVCVSLMRTAR